MLEWLKPILGDAYTDELDSKIAAEIGKNFVARADFNEVSTAKKKLESDVKARDEQLDELSKAQGATDELKTQIATLQQQNKDAKAQYEAEVAQIRLDNAVEQALATAGAKNTTAARALLVDFLKDAKVGEDGAVKGLSAEIESLAKADGTAFLFETEVGGRQNFKGLQPGAPGGNNPPADTGTYETRLADARKNGNTAAAVAIKREAAENGVFLM